MVSTRFLKFFGANAHAKLASHVMVIFLSRDIAMHGGIKKNWELCFPSFQRGRRENFFVVNGRLFHDQDGVPGPLGRSLRPPKS